jgi:hypothetical protein
MAGYRLPGYKCLRMSPAIRACIKNVWIGDPNPGAQQTLNWCVRHKLITLDKLTNKYKLVGRGHDVAEQGRCWVHKNEKFKTPV